MENDPNAEAASDEHSAQFDTIVISNMFEIFVAPEVRRRGLSIAPRSVDQFLAELPSGDGSVEVRLGDEARMAVTLCQRRMKSDR